MTPAPGRGHDMNGEADGDKKKVEEMMEGFIIIRQGK
jgi:hypothetical protein